MAALIQTPHTAAAQTLPLLRVVGRGAAAEVAPTPTLSAHPLQALLRASVADAAEAMIRRFAEELDPAIQALLAESRHAMETRALLDLSQAMSINRPALVRGFLAALRLRFDPLRRPTSGKGIFDLERLCLLPTEEMEENMLLTRLAELTEQQLGESGRQLQARLQAAARDLGLPALGDALSPQALPACFVAAFTQAGLEAAERVLAYRLVESHAIKGWHSVVQQALQTLDQQGLALPRSLAANGADSTTPVVSAATIQTLREVRASLVSGADGVLAKALLQATEPPINLKGAGLLTALAGSWLDALLAEAELPSAFAPDVESLRLPIIKAALCDPSFFAHRLHPVRRAVDELLQRAAFIGVQGYSLAPLRMELKDLVGRINIHGQFAVDALSMMLPISSELPQQFRHQLLRDEETRRESLLNHVRALATREIEARTLDVSLPTAARAALTRGFLPLLSTLLMRHGAASGPTRQARQLLERFVDSFALCTGSEERRAVLKLLGNTLLDAGLPDLQATGVAAELEKAYAELEEEIASSLPQGDHSGTLREINDILSGLGAMPALETWRGESAAPSTKPALPAIDTSYLSLNPITATQNPGTLPLNADPLALLLQPGHWFRVRDYKSGDDRWLSLSGVHLDQDRVSFSGFEGATALAMRASQFVEDLSTGLSEPLNPTAGVQQALQSLRAKPRPASDRLHSFG